jgi:hypothetical protein
MHPLIHELARALPPQGSPWKMEDRVMYMRVFDAALAMVYGGGTHLIWLDEKGELRVSENNMDARGRWSDETSAVRERAMAEIL